MAEFIEKTDTLNEGREKLNAAIQDAEDAKTAAGQAVDVSEQAKQIAQTAENKADNVQEQFNQVVIEGDSSVEAAQARVDKDGKTYGTLKERLDTEHGIVTSQLAETNSKLSVNLSQRKKGSSASISIILDDGKIDDLTRFLPIAEAKNFPFAIAVVTSWVGTSGHLTYEQLHQMEDTGLVEIIAHSHEHERLVHMSPSELANDIKTNYGLLRSNGFNPQSFVYPYNEWDTDTVAEVQKYYDYAFARFPTEKVKNYPKIDNQTIDRVSLGSYFDPESIGMGYDTTSLEYYKYRVDEAVQNNSWLVFAVHPEATSEAQMQIISQLVDYIKSQGIDILKPSDAFNIHGNMIQTRNFTLDKDGFTVSNYGVNVASRNAYKYDDPITVYPENSITHYVVDSNGSEGFPRSAGTVTVYNLGHLAGYVRREFRAYESQSTWVQNINPNGEWRYWEELVRATDIVHIVEGKNAYTAQTPPSEFPNNKITSFYVNSSGASGFPSDYSGKIDVHRIGDEIGYTYQIYHRYGSTRIYKRNAISNTEWSFWKEVSLI